MKNIKEDYVTFEVAKLLKKKGFIQPTLCYYFEDGEFRENKIQDTYGYYGEEYTVEYEELLNNWNNNSLTKKNGDKCFGCSKNTGYFETYCSPGQGLVLKWLREKYRLNVWIDCNQGGDKWIFTINFIDKGDYVQSDDEKVGEYPFYSSYEECTEAAILYCIKHLIK